MTFIFRISDQKDVGPFMMHIEVGMHQTECSLGYISTSQEQ